jgi:hypothetical protein
MFKNLFTPIFEYLSNGMGITLNRKAPLGRFFHVVFFVYNFSTKKIVEYDLLSIIILVYRNEIAVLLNNDWSLLRYKLYLKGF